LLSTEHKMKKRNTRMKFVGSTILPSQMKRNVFGTGAELEILLTVLYQELVNKSSWRTAGHDDDSD